MENVNKHLVINNFILKIIAMVLMTLDHIGIFLLQHKNTYIIGTIFRDFGRLALPLFIFLIVEGINHTKHFGKYFLRLSIIGAIFMIGQILVFYLFDNSINDFYSPILDLIIVALSIYLIKRKDKFSFLAILPVAYSIISFTVINIELKQNINIIWFPFFLRLPYSLIDLILGFGFYYSNYLAKYILKSNKNTESLIGTSYEIYTKNLLNSLLILVSITIFYIIYLTTGISYWNDSSQIFAIFSFLLLFFYNYKKGYNKKWFQYASYAYAPLHIIIIYLIFLLF